MLQKKKWKQRKLKRKSVWLSFCSADIRYFDQLILTSWNSRLAVTTTSGIAWILFKELVFFRPCPYLLVSCIGNLANSDIWSEIKRLKPSLHWRRKDLSLKVLKSYMKVCSHQYVSIEHKSIQSWSCFKKLSAVLCESLVWAKLFATKGKTIGKSIPFLLNSKF